MSHPRPRAAVGPRLLAVAVAAPWVGARAQEAEVVAVVGEADPPPGATVVTAADAGPLAAELADALEAVPGVLVSRLGGPVSTTTVSQRGAGGRAVAVTLDGVPLNPDGLSAVDLSELPLGFVSRAEVWRALPPTSMGDSGLGGLVALRAGPGVAAHGSVGSFGSGRGGVAFSGTRGRFDGVGALDVAGTAGAFRYLDDAGTRFVVVDDRIVPRTNADALRGASLLRGRWDGPRVDVGALSLGLLRAEGLPGPVGNPAADARLRTGRHLGVVDVGVDAGKARVTVTAWQLARVVALEDALGEVGVGATQQTDTTHTAGVRASAVARLGPVAVGGRVAARADTFSRRLRGPGEPVVAVVRPTVEGAVWAGWTPWSWLELDGGVTLRWVGPDTWAALPRASVTARPVPWLAVRAAVGLGFRPPDLLEVYGNQGFMAGNNDLQPERGTSIDLGLAVAPMSVARTPLGPVTLGGELAGFVGWHRDLIVYVQNSQRTVVPVNADAARLAGVEGAVALDVAGVLSHRLAWGFLDPRAVDPAEGLDGRWLPNQPRWRLTARTTVDAADTVAVGHGLRHLGPTFADRVNLDPLPARTVHDVWLRVRPAPGWPVVELALRNVADRLAADVAANPLAADAAEAVQARQPVTDAAGYPLPGRSVWLTLSWSRQPRASRPGGPS